MEKEKKMNTPGLRRVADGRYSVEPGRNIYRDGKPFVYVSGAGDYIPVEADDFTRETAHAVNCHAEMLEALRHCLRSGLLNDTAAFDMVSAAIAKAEGKE
jgi:hypothetical protein